MLRSASDIFDYKLLKQQGVEKEKKESRGHTQRVAVQSHTNIVLQDCTLVVVAGSTSSHAELTNTLHHMEHIQIKKRELKTS